ncbi:protein PEAK3 isoform X2 [Ambystoma mexicanum]
MPPPLPPKQLIRTRSLPLVKPCCHQMWATQFPGASFSSQHPKNAERGHNLPSSPRCREKTTHDRRLWLSKCQSLDEAAPASFSYPRLDMERMTFATPDDELCTFFQDLKNQKEVQDKVRKRHLMSLRHIAARLQEKLVAAVGVLQPGMAWEDYRFLDSEPCCQAGDALYYRVCLATEPQRILAAKVHKINGMSDAPRLDPVGLALQRTIPPHFNIQELGDCFTGDVPLEPFLPSERGISWASGNRTSRLAQIALTTQLPCKTLADYLKEFHDIHTSEPSHYERLACLLLLQLCNGLQHLKVLGITHCDLRPENLLIVEGQQATHNFPIKLHLPRLVISNFSKAKHRMASAFPSSKTTSPEQARLAPELLSNIQYKKVDEFQMGILIYEVLHQANPFQESSSLLGVDYSTADLPAISALSPYSQGLQRLAALLLHADPRGRMSICQAKTILQVLLWGPSRDLFRGQALGSALLQNWIEVKRALLILAYAEQMLNTEVARALEEWLCCQYFTEITDDEVLYATRILYIL